MGLRWVGRLEGVVGLLGLIGLIGVVGLVRVVVWMGLEVCLKCAVFVWRLLGKGYVTLLLSLFPVMWVVGE